jgi:esterase/lipase superfamily enzyme
MVREYHKWHSPRLGREMELLVFGHAGLPVVVFPTSGGRFYEFEDRQMIAALSGKIDAGRLQVFCVD